MNTQDIINEIKEQLQPALDKWIIGQCEIVQQIKEHTRTEEYNSIKSEKHGKGIGTPG